MGRWQQAILFGLVVVFPLMAALAGLVMVVHLMMYP